MKLAAWIIPFFLLAGFIQAQVLQQPCQIQGQMRRSICIDPPGCIVLRPGDFTDATPPFQFLWDNGHTGESITYSGSNIPSAICHTVTVTDALGCVLNLGTDFVPARIVADTILHEDQPLTYFLSTNDSVGIVDYVLVAAPTHGELTLNTSGLATFVPDETWCGIDYFRYAVRTDCGYSQPVTCLLNRTDCSVVLATSTDCNGECTGTAYVQIGEDIPQPVVYQWPGGQVTDTIRGVCSGQYTLTVTDVTSATHLLQYEIPATTFNLGINGPASVCKGTRLNFGPEIDLVGEDTASISYSWTGMGVNGNVAVKNPIFWTNDGLSNGPRDYRLIATTQGGCIDSAFHTTVVNPRPTVETLPHHSLVYTPALLEVTPEFAGGTPPYQFLWTGQNGIYSDRPTLTWPGVTPYYNGRFEFRITDANGCASGRVKGYTFPDSIQSNIRASISDPNHIICKGSDLRVRFRVANSSNFEVDSFKWVGPNGFYADENDITDNHLVVENIQPSDAGTYFLEIFSGSYTLRDSMNLEVSENVATVLSTDLTPLVACDSPTGGSFEIEIDGPGPFRSYIFGTGSVYANTDESPIIHDNLSSSYGGRVVQIRTGHNDQCYVHTQIPDYSNPVTTSFAITAADCENENGSVSLEIDPAPERVRWFIDGQNSLVDTTLMIDNVPAGWHSVRIENAAGCTWTTVPFYMPAVVSFDLQMNAQPSCFDAAGELEVLVEQPTDGVVDINWSNGANGLVNSNLSAGWHSVTVTDDSGCSRHENFFLPATESCLSTISGQVLLNTDCVCERDSNYLALTTTKVCVTSDSYMQCTFTNHAGEYTLVLPETGLYEISSDAFNDNLFSESCSPEPVMISTIGQHVTTQDVFYCGAAVYDASVSIYCDTPRPGFEQTSSIRLRNSGVLAFDTTYISATISSLIDVTSIFPEPIFFNQSTNEITWESTQRLNRLGYVDFNVTGTVIGELGEEVINLASVALDNPEAEFDNNEDQCSSIIIGSYDPNDKQVSPRGAGESGTILPADSLLRYTIRFQNTGTDTAFTVIVRDTLDREVFDLNSIHPIRSSHPVSIDIDEGNIMVFSFFDILLPDSTTSLAESSGYVEFEIKLTPGLLPDVPIENTAAIYFDFNEPITTNTTLNSITSARELSVNAISFDVFPNPSRANANLRIELEEFVEKITLEVFDIQGRFIQRQQWNNGFSAGTTSLPLTSFDLANGTYLLKLSTEHSTGIRRWIKF